MQIATKVSVSRPLESCDRDYRLLYHIYAIRESRLEGPGKTAYTLQKRKKATLGTPFPFASRRRYRMDG